MPARRRFPSFVLAPPFFLSFVSKFTVLDGHDSMDEDAEAIAASASPPAPAPPGGPQEELVMDEIVDHDVVGKYTGQVKWFNDRLGYGFCTVCDGTDRGKDIFVHHTGIRPVNSNYKTLRKGEYVNFNLTNGHNGPQAVDVTGICGGALMCDVMPVRRIGEAKRPPPPR
jgi:CspA family cold shock protein